MSRDRYAWAPETVRHLFRAARFGACVHGVRLERHDRIVWAARCDVACGGVEEPNYSALFALGHHLEVPGSPAGSVFEGTLRAMARAVSIDEAAVREAVPAELFGLATALRVQRWGSVDVTRDGRLCGYVAVGFVLGLPTCMLAPWKNQAWTLEPRSAA